MLLHCTLDIVTDYPCPFVYMSGLFDLYNYWSAKIYFGNWLKFEYNMFDLFRVVLRFAESPMLEIILNSFTWSCSPEIAGLVPLFSELVKLRSCYRTQSERR